MNLQLKHVEGTTVLEIRILPEKNEQRFDQECNSTRKNYHRCKKKI